MDMKEGVMDIARTAIKSFGGALVASGMITADQNATLAGAAAIAIGLIWSWVSTYYFSKEEVK
jgi:hypothetical protein